MIDLGLSECVHKKRVKMRNIQHFTASCIGTDSYVFYFIILPVFFFKCSTLSQNVEFHIYLHMETGLS